MSKLHKARDTREEAGRGEGIEAREGARFLNLSGNRIFRLRMMENKLIPRRWRDLSVGRCDESDFKERRNIEYLAR